MGTPSGPVSDPAGAGQEKAERSPHLLTPWGRPGAGTPDSQATDSKGLYFHLN